MSRKLLCGNMAYSVTQETDIRQVGKALANHVGELTK